MRLAIRFFTIVIGLWLLRRGGVQVDGLATSAADDTHKVQVATLRTPASATSGPDIAQIVNLMAAEPCIGLVLQINQPGEQLRAIRFDGPGGRA